jgi:hypothetical protein
MLSHYRRGNVGLLNADFHTDSVGLRLNHGHTNTQAFALNFCPEVIKRLFFLT